MLGRDVVAGSKIILPEVPGDFEAGLLPLPEERIEVLAIIDVHSDGDKDVLFVDASGETDTFIRADEEYETWQ
jgi:hypothetical protein